MFSIDEENIQKLIGISKDAGYEIMDIYNTNFEVVSKDDQSPLTKADILSNKIICDSLKRITPNIPILSEESSTISFHDRSKWSYYWLVDPLDGTKEFVNKNGEFTTNIALIKNNAPIFGIIHVPSRNETYWGSKCEGSFMLANDNIKKSLRVRSSKPNSELRIVSSRSHPSGDLKLLLEKLDNYELVGIGSSLKFCLIAKGEADCYPRLGPTCEWDTAAGEIIAISAGADVVTLDDMPLDYNKKDLLNPYFLVSNNQEIKKRILSLI